MAMRRWATRLGAAAGITLLFWLAAEVASAIPAVQQLRTSVHGLSLADYRAGPGRPLSPLSHRIIAEANRDAITATGTHTPANPSATPGPEASPTPSQQPGPSPTATPTPGPSPSPTPSPSATPAPVLNGLVQGVVRRATTSSPIAGARVQTTGSSTSTDSSGSYRLSLPAGIQSITASAPGFLAQTQTAAVTPGGTTQLDFALAPASIGGLVVDSLTGAPIPNATVVLSPGGLRTTTDVTGAFTFPAVDPGTYTVSASAPTYATATQNVTVAGGQKASVTIKLSHSLPGT